MKLIQVHEIYEDKMAEVWINPDYILKIFTSKIPNKTTNIVLIYSQLYVSETIKEIIEKIS